MIKFSCPGCSATYTVGDEKGGKTGKCPKCGSAFQIPMPEGAAPVPVPPPPPPPAPEPAGPVGDFTFGGGDADDETPKKKKKPASKADIDADDDDVAPPKSKGKSKFADDDDDFDNDDDDFDDKKKKKGKGGPAEKGKSLAIGAGVFHIIMALAFMGCGIYNGFCGAALSSANETKTTIVTINGGLGGNTGMNKNAVVVPGTSAEQAKALNMRGKIDLGSGVCVILLGVLAIPAAIGCMMRKPFGKYLSFVVGPLAVLMTVLPLLAKYLLAGSDVVFALDYVSGCGGGFFALIYAGFTIFAMIKAVPSAPKADKKKASKLADDDDEEDMEEEKPAAKPSKYGKSKKVVVEEDEDDEDDDEEEEEEKPKPKKRR